MLNFFQYIADFVSLVFNMVVNFVSNTILLFTTLIEAIVIPQSISAYVFPFLGTSVLIVYAISVVKLIIGR